MSQRTSKHPPKSVVSVRPVSIFAVTYVDGESYADTRFVAKVGDNIHFLHPEGVDNKIKQPASWLKDKLREIIPTVSEVVEVPENEVELPTESLV